MIDPSFRPITSSELAILRQLCELNFEGRDQVLAQLDGLEVKQIDSHGALGCLEFRVHSPVLIPGKGGNIVEGHYTDDKEKKERLETGGLIQLILFVADGKLDYLEVVNSQVVDGKEQPIKRLPESNELWLFSPYEINRKW
jgi:hypothetical protein